MLDQILGANQKQMLEISKDNEILSSFVDHLPNIYNVSGVIASHWTHIFKIIDSHSISSRA